MDYKETIRKWRGDDLIDIPERDPKYEHELQGQLINRIGGFLTYRMVTLFQPAPSENHGPIMIALWESQEKRDRDLRRPMRPGKAFKKMFPWLSQVELAELVDWYRELNLLKNADIIIHESTEAKDFKLAYAGEQAPMANPETQDDRKSLNCSCMKYDFEHLPIHPAEVYASGDFTIVWAEMLGKIAGRCVIYNKEMRAGPIYGVSDTALDALSTYIYDKLGACPAYEHDGWEGARIKKIEYLGDLIGPYFDIQPQSVSDQGDHLVISDDGDMSAENINACLSA